VTALAPDRLPYRRGEARSLALGFASHLLAGVSPFLVAAIIARTSLLAGTALAYGIGALALSALLLLPRARRWFVTETQRLTGAALRTAFLCSLAGFLVAGVAYYIGLTRSARVAEYVFLTRLDWVVQAPVAVLVLREPWTRTGAAGAVLALAGGLLIVWTGIVGTTGLAAAACYVLASLAGYLGATRIARHAGSSGAAGLTVWRHVVNTVGFVVLALAMGQAGHVRFDVGTLSLGLLSATVLIGMFFCRFVALTRLPLWVLSAQAPVQAVVALVASRLTEGTTSAMTLVAVAMIAAGEVIVAAAQRDVAR
jgi:drug/metabolite transporter (DMT)-like permease